MKTGAGFPRIPERWVSVAWGVIGVVTGCVIGPGLYALVSPGTSTVWDWLGSSKEQLLTIGTFGLAIATYALFRKTADMADATRLMAVAAQQDSIRSDRQHQQILTGIIVLNEPRLITRSTRHDHAAKPGAWEVIHQNQPPFIQEFDLFCEVVNAGQGAAYHIIVKLEVRAKSIEVPAIELLNIGALNAGQVLDIGSTPAARRVSVYFRGLETALNGSDISATLHVEWTSVFGSEGNLDFVSGPDGIFTEVQFVMPQYKPIPSPSIGAGLP